MVHTKFLILFIIMISFSMSTFSKDVHVKCYTRKNGTYVKQHVRTSPDKCKSNNYSSSKTYSKSKKRSKK